jgi:hypothetical protein
MNQQYFGDPHDLFKFDLIFTIMSQVKPQLKSFMFIPMLTEYRPSLKDAIAGMKNKKLRKCFNKFSGENGAKKYFKEIKGYFESENIKTNIFPDMEFSQKSRREYFENIFSHIPKKSLIFLDPDTGLQADEKAEKKHLKFSELQEIFSRIDDNSILMIYQHFYRDRKKHPNFPAFMVSFVEKQIKERPLYISDNSIMVLFLTKNENLRKNLEMVLNQYKEKYPKSFKK